MIGGITNGWGGYVSGGNRGGYAGTASRWGQKDLGTVGRHEGGRTDEGEDEGEKKKEMNYGEGPGKEEKNPSVD